MQLKSLKNKIGEEQCCIILDIEYDNWTNSYFYKEYSEKLDIIENSFEFLRDCYIFNIDWKNIVYYRME